MNFLRFFFVMLFMMSIAVVGCKKDDTTTTTTEKVAFSHTTMKTWFDTNCLRCHGSGKANYKDWPYDATDYDGSIKKYISAIYKEVYSSKTMPTDVKLSAVELTTFKTWYDAGYPAK